jgi:hypothetical protein
LSVEAFHESVKDVEVTAEAARPLGAVGAVVSADADVGVRKCRECQLCAWLTVARAKPALIAIPRSIGRRFTMPPFVPWGLLSLNIYVVVAKRRRKRRGRDYRASACDAVISITRNAPLGDFDHTQCVFFYKKLQGERDSMTSVTAVVGRRRSHS